MLNKDINNLESVYYTDAAFSEKSAKISFFKVIHVHTSERKVDIEYLHSNVKERMVGYMSPFLNGESGIDFIPSVGDIGIVASTALNGRLILGFLSRSNRSSGINLLEGEILLKSISNGIIKSDRGGNIILTTEGGSSIYMGQDGRYILSSDSYIQSSEAMVEESDNFSFSQKFFEDATELDYTDISDLIEVLSNNGLPTLKKRDPVLVISAISKTNSDGTTSVIEIDLDDSDDAVVYSIAIMDKESQTEISRLSFDKTGNIEIKANRLIYDVGEIIYR